MSHYKYLLTIQRHCQKYACFFRFCKDYQLFFVLNSFCRNYCMTRMWCVKHIIKSSHQWNFPIFYMMLKHAKHLCIQRYFINPIMIVKSRLSSPAQMHCRCHMCVRPFHDFFQFLPVINLFKRHLFYRSTCDDKAIKSLIFDFLKRHIKFVEMAG